MKLRPRLTYANVVSSLCLFILLGGSAYAVTQIDPNSVGTAQLKANAVKSGKIANRTVKRIDAKEGAFATPQQLAGKLGVNATAANAAKLGGIGPGGFVKGAGSAVAAEYDVNFDDAPLTVPGGAQVSVQCGTTGYDVYLQPTANVWDIYRFRYRNTELNPIVENGPATITFTKQPGVYLLEGKSSAGPSVSLTVFARFDDATDRCHGRVRGFTYPN